WRSLRYFIRESTLTETRTENRNLPQDSLKSTKENIEHVIPIHLYKFGETCTKRRPSTTAAADADDGWAPAQAGAPGGSARASRSYCSVRALANRSNTLSFRSDGTGSQPQCFATSFFTASSRPYSAKQGEHSSKCFRTWSTLPFSSSPSI